MHPIRHREVFAEVTPIARCDMCEVDHMDNVAAIRDQCLRAEVPFFFKQWGGVQKKRAGRILEGRTWDEMPIRLNLAKVVLWD